MANISLNTKVVTIWGTILMLFCAIVTYNLWHSWTGTFESSRIVSQNLARSLAAHTSATIESIDAHLKNIEYLLNETEVLPHLSPKGTQIIASQIENSSTIFSTHIFNNRGEMAQSATPTKGVGFGIPKKIVNIKETEAFRTLSNPHSTQQNRLVIGHPVIGKITGEWMIPIARGMYDTDGQFSGVVLATVQIEKFESLYNAFEVPQGFTIALARKDGRFLVRSPFNPVFYSKSFSEIPFFREILPKNPNGFFEDSSSIDSEIRMIFYHSVSESPLVVTVTIIRDSIVEQWLSEEMFTIVITIIASILFTILALAIWKHARLSIEQHDTLEKTVTERTKEKDELIVKLSDALNEVKTLKGIIPICSYCHKIRNDEDAWEGVVKYVSEHTDAKFSHGICPECLSKEKEKLKKVIK
ncbi:MAG: cache domain-containing protein [Gammaproteobacteria bacterium]|nr:cache domain-containing protein [Gammaproteobacteria bacterium]